MTSPELEGVLALDKPAGPTSHDAVAAARRVLKIRRIGHTGTLDPFASGLLLLCVGRTTRIAEYLTAQPKSYRAVMLLGAETDTDDHTGTVTQASESWRTLEADVVEAALQRQQGARLQVPSSYSAKKIAGERLYERARRGEVVEAAPVGIEVHEIRMSAFSPPEVAFELTCSSGTYVRAIARDVGRELGCGAHLLALRRTAIGSVSVADAIPLDQLVEQGLTRPLMPALAAIAHLQRADVDEAGRREIAHGRAIAAPAELTESVTAIACNGELIAIGEVRAGRLQPRKVMIDG